MPMRPNPKHYRFDLEQALAAVVGLRSNVPADAFTADTLGTERAGSGVMISGSGLALTIGYLITEAESLWMALADGTTVPGHVVGYDQETGFGLVQALARLEVPHLKLGRSSEAPPGSKLVVASAGGLAHAVDARIVARQEFAGYWEYLLDEAIYTAPAHPYWGGAAAIDEDGRLIGIGSLNVQHMMPNKRTIDLNMLVPTDLVKPILGDLQTLGRPNRPARPWLGFYALSDDTQIIVSGVAKQGPARDAGLKPRDAVLAVGEQPVSSLAALFRSVWALGPAGVEVPLRIRREGETMVLTLVSIDRRSLLKGPVLH